MEFHYLTADISFLIAKVRGTVVFITRYQLFTRKWVAGNSKTFAPERVVLDVNNQCMRSNIDTRISDSVVINKVLTLSGCLR